MEQDMSMNKSIYETESIGKLISKFAIPCVISLLVNSLYNIVDQIFIGRGVGYLGNAATNVAFPFVIISMAFSFLIGDGSAAFLSLRLGQGEHKQAKKGVGSAITMIFIVGILFMIFGYIFKNPLLLLFGATEKVMPFAQDYIGIILFGLPFSMVSISLNSIIRADGSPQFAMFSMLIGAVINTILDPIFIFEFNMSVQGAAIATVIGQIVSFLVSLSYFKKFKSIKFEKSDLKIDFNISKTVLSFGISSFINQIAITVVMIVMNNSLKYYGALSQYGSEIPLSALGIVMKVNQILISVVVGIAIGSQPIIGYNYGAKNYDRVKKTLLTSVVIASFFTVTGFIMFEFFPQTIVNIFGQEDALYNEFATKCFKIFLVFCVFTGFQIISGIFFQAIGKPLKSALISLSRQIVFFVPAVLILPQILGLEGCLYAGPLADLLSFLLAFVFIILEIISLNKKHKNISEGVV